MGTDALHRLAQEVIEAYGRAGKRIATAESCTGGLIAGTLTDIAGSSTVVERGFVTYSNEAKVDMLGVPEALIGQVGAVSEEVARSMAEGALDNSPADVSVAVTGIAGPGGGTAGKPVGLVHFATAAEDSETRHHAQVFEGDRASVRRQTVRTALELLLARLDEERVETA